MNARSGPSSARAKPLADGAVISLPVVQTREIRRSRSGPRRAIVLAIIQLLMIAHFVQWIITGHTLAPVEPSESMELVKRGVINAGAIFFGVALLATLVLGRWFCGWGCHIVMLQDLCGWMLRKVGIHPKPFRSRLLLYVPFILAIYMFVWPAVYRWGIVPLSARLHQFVEAIPALAAPAPWPGLSLEVTTSDFWHTFPGVLVAIPFLLVCGFATVYFLGNKGFCTYGCPYGGFFAPLEQYAPGRIRVTDACEQCGHCTAVCTSNVRVHEEVREYGMVVDPGCMKCLDCVSVCPNDALYFGFGRPAVVKKKPKNEAPSRRPDLSMAEEIGLAVFFGLSFFAVRGVYGVIPMLMAAGVAGCVTYLALLLWRMMRRPSVSLHRFRLRYEGAVTRAGFVFIVLAALTLLLTAHSGVVQGIQWAAGRADAAVTTPRSAVFAPAPMRLPEPMLEQAGRTLRLYRRAGWIGDGGIGLLPQATLDVRQAWLHACRQEFADAERLLRRRNDRVGRADAICRDVAMLMLLQFDEDRAREYYAMIAREEPGFYQTRDGWINWLEREGQIDEAIRLCREGIDAAPPNDPGHLHLLRRLSLLLMEAGRLDESIAVFERTIEIEDDNPASYVMLAEALRRRGEPDRALEMMRHALTLAPQNPNVLEAMARLLDATGQGDEARVFWDRAERVRRAGPPPGGGHGHGH